jgi:hypothetical protein
MSTEGRERGEGHDRGSPVLRGEIAAQVGGPVRRVIGALILGAWLAFLGVLWITQRRASLAATELAVMVAGGPVVTGLLSRLVPWWLQRRQSRSLSFRDFAHVSPIKLADIEGWHAIRELKLILISLKSGSSIWFLAHDEDATSAAEAWLAGTSRGRVRVCGAPSVGAAGWVPLGLPLLFLAGVHFWSLVSDSYAPMLSSFLLGPIVLCLGYFVAFLLVILTDVMEVVGQAVTTPIGRRLSAKMVRVECSGSRSGAGRLLLSGTESENREEWTFHPAPVLTPKERRRLGANEAEALRQIIVDRARVPETVYRA